MTEVARYLQTARIAYFSMEIGIRPEMHTYSGGLGILAGDAARAAADLDLPIVFVTLACREGYLRQEIDGEGNQVDLPDPWNPDNYARPLNVMVAVEIEGRSVWIRPWLYELKSPLRQRVPIILLDTSIAGNDPRDRGITNRLYGGDHVDRIKQEIILGIGGERMLRALGFSITTFHLNEGHAALLALSLLAREQRLAAPGVPEPADYAVHRVRKMCVFTTHTPVEAGHDRFDYHDVQRVMENIVPLDRLKQLAGADNLNMTRLALNLSGYVNGVARRHAETAQRMFPGYEVRAITNGAHVPTWMHFAIAELFRSMLPHWAYEPMTLRKAVEAPADALWEAHQQAKRDLIATVERTSGVAMSPDVPLLGFARRMTGYKRPDLLFSDLERLQAIHARHPFQLVMAGKAHPRDQEGKALIRAIHGQMRALKIPMAFLPNYDMALAAKLVSGTDVWLNTPLPPMEASGTSGMKAAFNGVLNLSVLDGWWLEAWEEGVTGWCIGADGESSPAQHAAELYRKLEEVVLPTYYKDRARWVAMMQHAISKVGSAFNSQRMMRRYATEAYIHR